MYGEKINGNFPSSTPLHIHASMLLTVFTLFSLTPASALAQADCYSFKACSDQAVSAGVPELALPYYDKALELWRPENGITEKAAIHNSRGECHKTLKNYDESAKDFSRAIELVPPGPQKASYYKNRGSVYESMELYDKAAADYDKGIQLEPKNPVFYARRAGAYLMGGEYAKALPDYKKSMELEPSVDFSEMMGVCYFHLEQYYEAADSYSKALKGSAGTTALYENRGKAYAAAKEYKKAAADFSKALKLSPGNIALYNSRGAALWLAGEKAAAKKDFFKASQTASLTVSSDKSGYASQVRGVANLWLGKCKEAREDLEKAASLSGEWSAYMQSGARAWLCEKDKDGALGLFRKAAGLSKPKGMKLSVMKEFLRHEIKLGYFLKDLRKTPDFSVFIQELDRP